MRNIRFSVDNENFENGFSPARRTSHRLLGTRRANSEFRERMSGAQTRSNELLDFRGTLVGPLAGLSVPLLQQLLLVRLLCASVRLTHMRAERNKFRGTEIVSNSVTSDSKYFSVSNIVWGCSADSKIITISRVRFRKSTEETAPNSTCEYKIQLASRFFIRSVVYVARWMNIV